MKVYFDLLFFILKFQKYLKKNNNNDKKLEI